VLRLIKMVADAARKHQIWFGVCGEMAGEIELTPLLLGLGVDELSVSPALVPRVKSAIRNVSREECEKLVEEVLLLDTPTAILERFPASGLPLPFCEGHRSCPRPRPRPPGSHKWAPFVASPSRCNRLAAHRAR